MAGNRLCDLLGIEVPIVLAPFGPGEEVRLAAEVCRAGALGSLGTATRSVEELRAQWRQLRAQTDRPFAINHTGRPLNEEAFEATLEERPAAISFHMGVPATLIARAHEYGITWIQTVGDVAAAEAARDAGADVLVAQGGEAGGNAGWISTLVLVPAVVDVAGGVPVVAAGGIADGRGIAAAFALGAQGVSLGTRFLATEEMSIDQRWKDRIVAADATEVVKVPHSERVMPPFTIPQLGVPYAPRSLRTELTDRLESAPEEVDPDVVGPELLRALRSGGGQDMLPLTGQSVELVHDVLPTQDLIARLISEAEEAARRAVQLS
ncbi:NAD(P)H-dependent flavin oxidoreductase [Actinopolymorpha pittospori]|uniref:Nitronate monooxygenase/enoyl-[acyl-carrier protein] reductase II n=1 Tax=Actinopolymorpha pittospori TaxID=648752 RepID=A0A927R9Z9_9ACTN|nr:nitronate monooxygenase [Actinopolymorpha pittospori]MBE1608417.1 nitronate monooxygenase/enoyl-[acyl-carrier protein] reductase II [Actinopolymorpha pittospori]